MYGIQKDGDIQQIAGNSHIVADDALSTTSENPIQNKVVTNALAGVPVIAHEETTTSTTPRDADTLDGHDSTYFATADSLNNKVKYVTYTATVDVSASGYVIALTYPTLSGYIAIGITNSVSGSNSTYAIPISLDSRRVAIRNVSTSALTSITLYTTVTYLKV